MDVDDINFMDLACILRITPDATLEKFPGMINASFFDGSNIAGTLKQKGLIEFVSTFPGPNGMSVTQKGRDLIKEADEKSTQPFDPLDSVILNQLSGGKRMPMELSSSLNIRSRDLALRLYKLYKQGLVIYELKNGNAELLLTENGFLKVKSDTQIKTSQAGAVPPAQQTEQKEGQVEDAEKLAAKLKKPGKGIAIPLVIIVVVIVVVALVYTNTITI